MIAATPKPPTGYPIRFINDLTGSVHIVYSPRTRAELLEAMLPIVFNPEDEDDGVITRACVHVCKDSLSVHVYTPNSLAEEVFGDARATVHRIFDFFDPGEDDDDGGIKAWTT